MEYKILFIEFGIQNIPILINKLQLKDKNITTYVNNSFFDVAVTLYENIINTVIISDYKGMHYTLIFLKMLLYAFPSKKVIILGQSKKNITNRFFYIQQGAMNYILSSDYENLKKTIELHYNSLLDSEEENPLSPAAHIILRIIKDNYHTKKNFIELVSRKSGYSASSINKVIKRETGKTVGKWVTELRINAAINLLTYTHLPIKSITSEVGYNSEQGFIKAFKSHTSKTPTQYRMNYYYKGHQEWQKEKAI